MPCYTVITIKIKDKIIAEKTLEQMGVKGSVSKNSNGTYSIALDGGKAITTDFRDKFYQEYGVQVATQKAQQDGYDVYRQQLENGEVELTLKQYV